MSLRHGVTAAEEHKLKALISKGKTWEQIVELCQPNPDKLTPPLLQDTDLSHVKKTIFDPLVKKLEEARKANFKTIHDYEQAKAKERAAAKAAKAEKDEQ